MANIAKVKKWDISNGAGIRTSVFFSGCTLNCKGCFNKEIQDFNVGEKFTKAYYEKVIKPTINEHIAAISLLGGDPLNPKNVQAVCELCSLFKHDFPDKDIWIWSGYTLDELAQFKPYENVYQRNALKNILRLIDVLVDGRFIEEKKDLNLKWRGSSNQRIIDVKKTIEEQRIVEYKG